MIWIHMRMYCVCILYCACAYELKHLWPEKNETAQLFIWNEEKKKINSATTDFTLVSLFFLHSHLFNFHILSSFYTCASRVHHFHHPPPIPHSTFFHWSTIIKKEKNATKQIIIHCYHHYHRYTPSFAF